MQDDQMIPVLTGDCSGVEEYWNRVGHLVGGSVCIVTEDANDPHFSAASVAIIDFTSEVDGCFPDCAAKLSTGIADRKNTLLCLAKPSTPFNNSELPDAILTAPCPAEVLAGTVNQLRRLVTREQELQTRTDALRSIGLTDPTEYKALDEGRPSVLAIGQHAQDTQLAVSEFDTVTCVSAPTLSAAQSYMNWHDFRLAIAYLSDTFGDRNIQEFQSVLKTIPLIVSIAEPDHEGQMDLYDHGVLDVLTGPITSPALEARVKVALRFYQRVAHSKEGLARTKNILSDLPLDRKRAFADAYRSLLAERTSSSSTMKSYSIEAYEPAFAAMTQDLSERAVTGIQSVLEIATRDEDLSLFLGDDQVLTILAGTDNAGAAVALRRIAAILKSTDLPATQDGQKIRVSLRGQSGA